MHFNNPLIKDAFYLFSNFQSFTSLYRLTLPAEHETAPDVQRAAGRPSLQLHLKSLSANSHIENHMKYHL